MGERRQDQGWGDRSSSQSMANDQDRYGDQGHETGQQYGQSGQSGQGDRAMTTRSDRGMQQRGSGGERDWEGYVVPYRYFGPGYNGVGYYAVFYQGADEPGQSGQGGSWAGSSQGSSQGQSQSQGKSRWGQQGWNQGGGGFAGKGPKGYQRSDERIREEINDRLTQDDRLDASEIEVQVRNGEATLTGTVPDRQMKRYAEDCADDVSGVRDVMNQLRVQSDDDSSRASSSSTTGTRAAQPSSAAPNGQRQTASTNPR